VGLTSEGNGGDVKYYKTAGNFAMQNGVTISVIGIEGTDCGIDTLAEAASVTAGVVTVVNPLELQRQMRQIIDNPVHATKTEVAAFLHPLFRFAQAGNVSPSPLHVEVGNVTNDTELTFEYSKQNDKHLDNIPFQVQVTCTRQDGSQIMRVITQKMPTTTDRIKAENTADISILALNAVHQSAHLAQNGKYAQAKDYLHSVQQLLQGIVTQSIDLPHYNIFCEEYANFVSKTEDLDTTLANLINNPSSSSSDGTAKLLHQMKNTPRTIFLSGERKDEIIKKRKNHTASAMSKVDEALLLEKTELVEKLQQKEDENRCIVCEERAINIVLIPCGHQILCEECSKEHEKQTDKCPTCSANITMRVKTFGR